MAELEDDLNRVSVELESPLLAEQQPSQSFRTVRSDYLNNDSVATSPGFVSRQTSSLSVPAIGTSQDWELNYREAAIYLQEGENNDRFDTHPRNQDALPAYVMVHNFYFYIMDLAAAMLVLLLALVEEPAVDALQLQPIIHASLELFGLTIIALGLGLKMRWMGLKSFAKHKRTLLKAIFLLVMYSEALVVIVRQQSHFRVTRALRPIFLIDCHYCGGVRRVLRQIIQSSPPIIEMLFLLGYFMLIFSILGFYIFVNVEDDIYFQTLQDSFVNLFVLMTTANFPDVMMPAYNHNPWSAIFFIVFLVLELYFLINLLLAVVYDTFTGIEKKKFKKLTLHMRKATSKAFRLLCSRRHPGKVTFAHFEGLLKYYSPNKSKRDVLLTFKTLNTSGSGKLDLQEFHNVFEVSRLKWKSQREERLWFESLLSPMDVPFRLIQKMVSSRIFEAIVYIIIAINGIVFIIKTIIASRHTLSEEYDVAWYDWFFVGFYVMEALLKILGFGPRCYFTVGWNLFDFIITVTAFIGVVTQAADKNFQYIIILRPIRLLRIFKINKRYRDVFGTLYELTPRMASVGVCLLIIYYFYAIIGMEFFAETKLENCCRNDTFADYYSNSSRYKDYFYLNNFDDILRSYVTLFELTVVNNWHIIMGGYASVVSEWSRIYFFLFYLSSMVVVTIVIAFILEAFLFRIQYHQRKAEQTDENQIDDGESESIVEVAMSLTADEVDEFFPRARADVSLALLLGNLHRGGTIAYRGTRQRTKADLSKTMYAEEVKEWIKEADREHHQDLQNFVRQMSRNTLLTELGDSTTSTPTDDGTTPTAPPTATPIVQTSTATAMPARMNPFLGRPQPMSTPNHHTPTKGNPSINKEVMSEQQYDDSDDDDILGDEL
ncbi:two pore channel protein 1-like [Lytechinus pictus]|uniref:two pore channel protein 1-like n=1 Tax=Lytechinus pictus TaxID=7653 RepID=UPI0030B9EB1B